MGRPASYDYPPRGLREIACMKREMQRWDARRRLERRARMLAAGFLLLLIGAVWMGEVRPALTQFGGGGVLLLAGMALVAAASKR